MANSITGINDDIISQAVLEGYTTAIAPLAAFATDFSSEAARRGEKVSIMRDNTAIDAAVDKTTHADYTIQVFTNLVDHIWCVHYVSGVSWKAYLLLWNRRRFLFF